LQYTNQADMNTENTLELLTLKDSFGDDTETLVAILEMFMQEVPQDHDMLKDQIARKDVKQAGLTAHKIKSSYRTLDMQEETEILQEMETLAKSGSSMDKITILFDQYENSYQDGLQLVLNTIKDLKAN
jgi:HPt (histidine-containing phosphotransfer) domain-containing protein